MFSNWTAMWLIAHIEIWINVWLLLAYSKAIDICSELKMDGNEKKIL